MNPSRIDAAISKRWAINECDEDAVRDLQARLKISPMLCRLLVSRGIDTYEKAEEFFRPDLKKHLYDPFIMKDMRKAVDRIAEAITNGEKILIYGDYDVDGTTAVSLVYDFLTTHLHENCGYYIPDRYTEGYGISQKSMRFAADEGYNLVIALDCGVKAFDSISLANELGLDVIVCDHHLPAEELPKAFAILDPKQKDCEYPYKELSGCGIGFKLIQGLICEMNMPHELAYDYLDLAVVSIAADIVPMTGENRVLANFGLKKLNNDPSPGLRAMIETAALKTPLNIGRVVFGIAPRINAAGRMLHGKKAVELLTCKDPEEAVKMAKELQKLNDLRKDEDQRITEEALEQIQSDPLEANKITTVVFDQNWHKGVIGIVASRLIEHHYRPTIVLTRSEDGSLTGSARSIKGFDIHEALEDCADLLEQFGGHVFAAGLSLREENLPAFKEKFESIARERIAADDLVPEVRIDTDIGFDELNNSFFRILEQFAPFGPGNPQPVFVSNKVQACMGTKAVKGDHLKINVRQPNSQMIGGIAFGMGHMADALFRGNGDDAKPEFDICYSLEENTWMGKTSLQLKVRDIRLEDQTGA